MSRYYEDARRLAYLHARWARTLPGKRHRFVVTTGGGPGLPAQAPPSYSFLWLEITGRCGLRRYWLAADADDGEHSAGGQTGVSL